MYTKHHLKPKVQFFSNAPQSQNECCSFHWAAANFVRWPLMNSIVHIENETGLLRLKVSSKTSKGNGKRKESRKEMGNEVLAFPLLFPFKCSLKIVFVSLCLYRTNLKFHAQTNHQIPMDKGSNRHLSQDRFRGSCHESVYCWWMITSSCVSTCRVHCREKDPKRFQRSTITSQCVCSIKIDQVTCV